MNRTSFWRALSSLCLVGTVAFSGGTQAHAAGDAAATSGYATIQPNANVGATGYNFTFSWVAPDTDNSGAGTVNYTDTRFGNGVGNGGAKLDNVNNWNGGNYNDGTNEHWYRSAAASSQGALRWEQSKPNEAVNVQWTDPANNTLGVINPTTATPKFDTIGDWRTGNGGFLAYGSGIQGVTGVLSTNPNGTGAVTGNGVGTTTDDDSGGTDDFGLILSGYDDVDDPTSTNPYPNKGYVQAYVPYHTDGTPGNEFIERFIPGTFTNNAAIELVVTTDANYTPKLAVSGDFDSDSDIDNADIGLVGGGFTGAGATGNWYADGDTDADGDIDNADIGAVNSAFSGAAAFAGTGAGNLTDGATIADLVYDPATGNIKMDASEAAGGIITSFQLENGVAGTFIPGNYNSLLGTGNYGGGLEDDTTLVIGDSDLSFTGFSGIQDFGDIFPTGLDLTALQAYLSTAVYTGEGGSGQQQFDLVLAAAEAIPEPSTLTLSALGLLSLGFVGWRRRQR